MERKKIIPAIRGRIEYIDEDHSKFDKYQIRVGDNLVAFIYMPRQAGLIPKSIFFERETTVTIDY